MTWGSSVQNLANQNKVQDTTESLSYFESTGAHDMSGTVALADAEQFTVRKKLGLV